MKVILLSYSAYILANLLDVLSSMSKVEGFYEENPFMRDHDKQFVLGRSLAVKGLILLSLAGMSSLLYVVISYWNERVGGVVAALVPCWMTFTCVQTAIENTLLALGWYSADAE